MTSINSWNFLQYSGGAIARGANTGRQVANINRRASAGDLGALSQLMHSDIQYTTKENGKFSIDGGLAYSKESLKGIDANHDGIVSVNEAGPLGRVIDLNNDGRISASENLAYTMYQDSAGKLDGKVTASERILADQAMMANPAKARQQMAKIHNGHNLAQREQQLDNKMMPQQMMQPLMMIFSMVAKLFSSFFGQGQSGTNNRF